MQIIRFIGAFIFGVISSIPTAFPNYLFSKNINGEVVISRVVITMIFSQLISIVFFSLIGFVLFFY
ncbi:hypothetical protein NRP93_001706 [Clostridium botulinum]|nr:hypothetical protein [Clostridium botulinum]